MAARHNGVSGGLSSDSKDQGHAWKSDQEAASNWQASKQATFPVPPRYHLGSECLSNWLVCINSSVGCVGLCVQLTNCSVSANNDLQGRGNVIPIVARHGYTVPSCNWCTLVLCPAMGMDGWAQDEVHQTPRKRRESGDISLTSWVSLSWLLLVTNFQSHCRKHS